MTETTYFNRIALITDFQSLSKSMYAFVFGFCLLEKKCFAKKGLTLLNANQMALKWTVTVVAVVAVAVVVVVDDVSFVLTHQL